jgi:DNA-binding transcriptional LysR family regulator
MTTQAKPYKDLTIQQLRSFCATAKAGSLVGAAEALGLAHPTVWKQVHALEQTFGVKLVEPHVRGCRLTEAGEVLRGLVEPTISNLDPAALRTRLAEALDQADVRIPIAAPPRILGDDLAPCVAGFVRVWPRSRFTLIESHGDEVAGLVASGQADIGFTAHIGSRAEYPLLTFDPWYQLDVLLITPRDHPLAQRKHIRPEDLRDYPILNSPLSLRDTQAHRRVVELGLYDTQPRYAEARHAEVIWRYVEAGLGIALVTGLWPSAVYPTLHVRLMRRAFGRTTVTLVRRVGAKLHPTVEAFTDAVRTQLGRRET